MSFFRLDHGLGPEGSMVPPGQSRIVPSNSDPSMYSPNHYPGQQRCTLISLFAVPTVSSKRALAAFVTARRQNMWPLGVLLLFGSLV